MPISPSIPEIGLFQNVTLKIQGQGHGLGQIQGHILGPSFYGLTSLPLFFNQPSHPCDVAFQNMTIQLQGKSYRWGQGSRSHSGFNILSTHTPFIPYQLALPFLGWSHFKIWPWKSKVKVIAKNLTLKIEGQSPGWGQSSGHMVGPNSLSTHISLLSCQSALPFLRNGCFKIWPWKSKV